MNALPHVLLYTHFRTNPYFNMAFDDWMLSRVLTDSDAVLFRLYTWGEGTITIGLNQRAEAALDWTQVSDTPVIRRVTGGRALFHDQSEYTYAMAAGASAIKKGVLSGSTAESASTVASLLAGFLARIGVSAEYVRQSSPTDIQPVATQKAPCFASAAKYELVSSGRKVVASAQRRIGDVFMQHGSIKIYGIASHPALSGVVDAAAESLQPIEQKQLDGVITHLESAIAESLRGVVLRGELTSGEQLDIVERSRLIQAVPLGRREIR